MSNRRKAELLAVAALVVAATAAEAAETITYRYDAKGRLRQTTHAGSVNGTVVANYTLDAADNRTRVKVTGAP